MPTRTRTQAPKHTTRIVRNRSSRRGSPILNIAIHSTESNDIPHSTDDLKSVGNWFDNPASDASAHAGIDGDGHIVIWVPSSEKAWTILNANPFTLNIEFVARAAQPGSAWEDAQIKSGAKLAAWWALQHDLPAARGAVRNLNGQCVSSRKGIITHLDVTRAGFGSHVDPGPNFPMDDFLKAMRYYKRYGWVVGS